MMAGRRLGPYEILAALGAGGMGEVYRARDPRVHRDVAVKILPPEFSADPERLKRFQIEARAAGALNHPNLLTLFDLGAEDGTPYAVYELLEGQTLRERLGAGALPLRQAIAYATQIAHGLAAVHEQGIVHRDLKPENLFITSGDRIKILDFGLARLQPGEAALGTTTLTVSGTMVGTAGYMAPEQVRGEHADARADLFAFGCVLYEMLRGSRAFPGASAVERMSATLHDDPPPLDPAAVPEALGRIVAHCLERTPERRFRSAHDLAFALESLGTPTGTATHRRSPRWRPRTVAWAAGAALLIIAGVAAAVLLLTPRHEPPQFARLTARRGSMSAARYAPDGRTIVYSAAWDGEPNRIYTTRVDSHESSPLPLPPARLLSVSSAGELAIAIGPGWNQLTGPHSTLARVPLTGGAPRELLRGVLDADWSPDGSELAVIRTVGLSIYSNPVCTAEYPLGHKIYASTTGLMSLRVSPDGGRIALVEMAQAADYTRGRVVVVDRAGRARPLTPVWENIRGLAWSARGHEICFAASRAGEGRSLRAVAMDGHDRVLYAAPGTLALRDVRADGSMLVSSDNDRIVTMARAPDTDRERDLSWHESSYAADLTRDGRTLIFTEWGEAPDPTEGAVGARGTDGSPVIKLGQGYAGGISPDGQWVVAVLMRPRAHLRLLPMGPGEPRDLDPGPVRDLTWACWSPDGRRVVFGGIEPGHVERAYVQDIAGGPPRAITPERVTGGWRMVSPDSRFLLAEMAGGFWLLPLAGGPATRVPAIQPSDAPLQWSADGRAVIVRADPPSLPARIVRVDLATGARRLERLMTPTDPAGVTSVMQIVFTADERAYAYTFTRQLSDLYEVKGLR